MSKADGCAVLFLTLVMNALYCLFAGWMFMLVVQIIHDHWISNCPTIGYRWAVVVVALIRLTLFSVSSGRDE